jgi:hypothetical protein
MKTTIEIPDALFRKAKSKAAERGQTLRHFVAEALSEKLSGGANRSSATKPAWMRGFGKLRRLHKETKRIELVIAEEFDVIDQEDRAALPAQESKAR